MALYFLTGHNGFIGSHLLTKLRTLGHTVITDMRFFDTEKWDCILHLAGKTHTQLEFDPQLYEANIVLTKKILSTPYRTVVASSCSARHLTNPYSYSKRYCEHLVEKHSNAVALRLFNVYGKNNNKGVVKYLIDQPNGARINVRGPEIVRDYVYVDDVVDEIIKNINTRILTQEELGEHLFERFKLMEKHKRGQDLQGEEKILFHKMNNTGVKDVGTGIGTETIDVINLYMKLSGKEFIIDVSEAWDSEPKEMIAEYGIPGAVSLEQGLLKTIQNEK